MKYEKVVEEEFDEEIMECVKYIRYILHIDDKENGGLLDKKFDRKTDLQDFLEKNNIPIH